MPNKQATVRLLELLCGTVEVTCAAGCASALA
jgi:hypothetical protein